MGGIHRRAAARDGRPTAAAAASRIGAAWADQLVQREIRRGAYQVLLFSAVATILLSGDVKLIKPDPRIFQALLERIGRSASECLFIDDSEENISTARSLGFETIRFESPEQLRRELQHRGLLPR